MAAGDFSTAHLNYLQRIGDEPTVITAGVPRTTSPSDLRRLFRVTGTGCVDKNGPAAPRPRAHPASEDAIVGLYGYSIPLAFLIRGGPEGVAVHLGTWSAAEREAAPAKVLDSRSDIVSAVWSGLYPRVEMAPDNADDIVDLPFCGMVLGHPYTKPPDLRDGASQMDRLIRAMGDNRWTSLILAEPVQETVTKGLRDTLINEIRAVRAAANTEMAPSPLAEEYAGLLKKTVGQMSQGQVTGAWRTAVYLLGTPESYWQLASVWRSVFSGTRSLPEPLRVWEGEGIAALAAHWALPDSPGPKGPGHYDRLFEYQTLLTSSQLSAYVHLPQIETGGFRISMVPDFDCVPPAVGEGASIDIGSVVIRGKKARTRYAVDIDSLKRHAFVAGVTGAGKTNTLKYLLGKAVEADVNFLAIEPAKREYRELLADEASFGDLTVFTLGSESGSPFRLNPFEVENYRKTPISTHINLLRSVFAASFGMWTPLPQVLEESLHRIYRDRGWNTVTNENSRLAEGADASQAFPTLSDLVAKVNEVTGELGFDREAEDRIRGSLGARLNTLRVGGKGCMLDVQQSLSMEDLLSQPVVLELEGMGDDDDKAFMMGLLLIRLAEYRRAGGKKTHLQHLLVIEEAHRLLTNVSQRGGEEEANPRGKAVEAFSNLLSEIRAYGQGVIIADQVPTKLAPDVIKNTALKIVHRIVAHDDRIVLAGAMNMSERQAKALAILDTGHAAVFSQGDDTPVLVGVDRVADLPDVTVTVESAWAAFADRHDVRALFRTYPTCHAHCDEGDGDTVRECVDMRLTTELPSVAQALSMFMLTLVTNSRYLSTPQKRAELFSALWSGIVVPAFAPHLSQTGHPPTRLRCAVTHGVYRYLETCAARYEWSFDDVAGLTRLLLPAVAEAAKGVPLTGEASVGSLAEFCEVYHEQCRVPGPFYGCDRACSGSCFFRFPVERFVKQADLRDTFAGLLAKSAEDAQVSTLLNKYDDMCDQLLVLAGDKASRREAILCFVIQLAGQLTEYSWDGRRSAVDRAIEAFDVGESAAGARNTETDTLVRKEPDDG